MTEPLPGTEGRHSAIAGNGDVLRTDAVRADLIGILDTVDLPIVVVGRDFTVARFNRPRGLRTRPDGIPSWPIPAQHRCIHRHDGPRKAVRSGDRRRGAVPA